MLFPVSCVLCPMCCVLCARVRLRSGLLLIRALLVRNFTEVFHYIGQVQPRADGTGRRPLHTHAHPLAHSLVCT
jgi:hypothetical protein